VIIFWLGQMLTAKGKYGLKAVVYLAALQPGTTAHAVDIAKANNISKKFLDAILSELRGYMLARSARMIKAGSVIRALDGPLAPIACASRTAYRPCKDCKNIAKCEVRRTMTLVRDATSNILDKLSLSDMVSGRR